MIDNDTLDYDIFQGSGYADGNRIKYHAKATYLLSHGEMMNRATESMQDARGLEDNHEMADYVSKKFETALKMEPHQMLGSGSKRGGNAMPLPTSTSGGGTIGSYVFDASKAMVPYKGGARRSRSTSRNRF